MHLNPQQAGVIGPITIDNLIVLAAALIGVGGSFWVFKQRMSARERKLRTALVSEMVVMVSNVYQKARILEAENLEEGDDLYVPLDPVANEVYTGNTSDLGLLDEDEINHVTTTYSRAISVRRQISALQDADSPTTPDVRKLRSDLITLNNELIDGIQLLNQNREEDWEIPDEITKLEIPDYDPTEAISTT